MTSEPSWTELEAEMLPNGRLADQIFDPEERLFYRLEEAYPVGHPPSGLSVRKPDFSVNREKHGGRPEFVLIPDWADCGIAEFRVEDVPAPITSEGGKVYSWAPSHVPLPRNYNHSEVWTFIDRTRCEKNKKINDLVYREFRQRLSEAMVVVKACTRAPK